ncbi:hypothetical protein F4861DRAFT_509823 [Xylaria intraflava]|nr:hypothetical protein F4861DRAFT_509823 [Xylaria intraflava]
MSVQRTPVITTAHTTTRRGIHYLTTALTLCICACVVRTKPFPSSSARYSTYSVVWNASRCMMGMPVTVKQLIPPLSVDSVDRGRLPNTVQSGHTLGSPASAPRLTYMTIH